MAQPNYWLFVSDVDYTLLGSDAASFSLAQGLQATSDCLITAYNLSQPCAIPRQTLADHPHLPPSTILLARLVPKFNLAPMAEHSAGVSRPSR